MALLALAIALIWVARAEGPAWVRRWFEPVPMTGPQDLALLLVAALLAMLVHECGHLLASLVLQFEILGGSIGPIQLQMLPGDSKFSWSMRSFFTGSVSAIPKTMRLWREATMVVVAAGPAATLGAGLMVARWQASGHLWILLQIAFIQVSMLLFFLGLVPNSRNSKQQNDARLFLDLACRNEGAEEMELKVSLKQQILMGERPQDYPNKLMERLAVFDGRLESQLLFAQALAQWAMDSDEPELAEEWDAHALALADWCGPRMRNAELASSACFDVIIRDDLQAARDKFAQVDYGALFPHCFEYRARAAQQIALGRMHRAPAFILKAQYALPRGATHYALERSLLAKLHMRVLTGEAKVRAASA